MNLRKKCTPCRIGTKRMLEIRRDHKGSGYHGRSWYKIGTTLLLHQGNLACALGQTAPNPVLSTLRYFRDEYIAHIKIKPVLQVFVVLLFYLY